MKLFAGADLDAREYVFFRIESLGELKHSSECGAQTLDWREDLKIIQRFYAYFTDDPIDPDENDETVGNPMAIIENDEIISFAVPFSFCEGELEIVAVATVPHHRNKGYCKALIARLARKILEEGMTATLTTRKDNLSMQSAAAAIGMRRIEMR